MRKTEHEINMAGQAKAGSWNAIQFSQVGGRDPIASLPASRVCMERNLKSGAGAKS